MTAASLEEFEEDAPPTQRTEAPWKLGYSGERIELTDPWKTPIHVETIAHALAHQCRFGGHTRWPYSVAAHSVLVSAMLEKEWGADGARAGLLHDAHEAYTQDIGTPTKRLLGSVWEEFEHDWECRVRGYFGQLDWRPELRVAVKHADTAALVIERATLMPAGGPSWGEAIEKVAEANRDSIARMRRSLAISVASGASFGARAKDAFHHRGRELGLWP